MILEFILTPIFWVLGFLVSLLPDLSFISFFDGFDFQPFLDLISPVFVIYPASLFILVISNVIFWTTVQFGWAVVEWFYKKIPGVN